MWGGSPFTVFEGICVKTRGVVIGIVFLPQTAEVRGIEQDKQTFAICQEKLDVTLDDHSPLQNVGRNAELVKSGRAVTAEQAF